MGGEGNGERERFCGTELCDDDDACRCELECMLDLRDGSEDSGFPFCEGSGVGGGGGSKVGMYDGGGDPSGSSGFVTERMRRCDDASAAFACAAGVRLDDWLAALAFCTCVWFC